MEQIKLSDFLVLLQELYGLYRLHRSCLLDYVLIKEFEVIDG